MVFPDSVCYFDPQLYPQVKGMLALTIDDAPCRARELDKAMIKEVLALLREFEAQATFFLCTDYVKGYEDGMKEALLQGHEVANHCPEDRSYADDAEEDFEIAYLHAEEVCDRLRESAGKAVMLDAPKGKGSGVRWFRAPHAKMSPAMRKVITRHGATHVLTDCYANDPWISDADFLARTMLDSALDGSVAVIHMPERGFREYNFQALRQFLEGLRDRQIRVVTLSALHAETLKDNSAMSA